MNNKEKARELASALRCCVTTTGKIWGCGSCPRADDIQCANNLKLEAAELLLELAEENKRLTEALEMELSLREDEGEEY